MKKEMQRAINTVRILSADAIAKAKSGHPGLAMGSAPMAFTLWANHMKASEKDPAWVDRDRFVLSAGHASMLQYSLLHLFGYQVSIDDIKNFRQFHSKTPGHPEFGVTEGVDATTGPLGQGLSMAVGMAIAESRLAAKFNTKKHQIVDHYTFALAGDGCMMEGITSEASSLAGHLKLGKLIVFYDDNGITIDGSTDLAFTEDVSERYRAYNWQVIEIKDGNDIDAIEKAIKEAKANTQQPTLIRVKTIIGYGSLIQGTNKTHGSPLSAEDIVQLKEKFGFDSTKDFDIPEDVTKYLEEIIDCRREKYDIWAKDFSEYCKENPELAKEWKIWHGHIDSLDNITKESIFELLNKTDATRNSGGQYMNFIAQYYPQLMGGSADLNGSTKTYLKGAGDFTAENRAGNNVFFGIREHAMGAISNGMALHGGIRPYCATFMVFSDYMKPAIRLSALMKLPVIYVFTHDSIGVGEDGATHEPIEQLLMLRSIPNTRVYRPADPRECAYAWNSALKHTTGPSVIVLSRQNLQLQEGVNDNAYKGGYVISPQKADKPDGILIASGSEVDIMIKAQTKLKDLGHDVSVVSILCRELYDVQSCEYKQSVLPKDVRKRVVMEAASTLSWHKYATDEGSVIGLDHFGESAPAAILYEKFGLTSDAVVEAYSKL